MWSFNAVSVPSNAAQWPQQLIGRDLEFSYSASIFLAPRLARWTPEFELEFELGYGSCQFILALICSGVAIILGASKVTEWGTWYANSYSIQLMRM